MRGVRSVIAAGLLMASVGAVDPGLAVEAETMGRMLYIQYCSACHGAGGEGDGMVAEYLDPPPVDLTGLARRNGGQFPAERLLRVVDGRHTFRAHGDPNMPVWGEVFGRNNGGGPADYAVGHGRMLRILDFVRTIQKE